MWDLGIKKTLESFPESCVYWLPSCVHLYSKGFTIQWVVAQDDILKLCRCKRQEQQTPARLGRWPAQQADDTCSSPKKGGCGSSSVETLVLCVPHTRLLRESIPILSCPEMQWRLWGTVRLYRSGEKGRRVLTTFATRPGQGLCVSTLVGPKL